MIVTDEVQLGYEGVSSYNNGVKVLFLTRKFPPSTGGMEIFARDLSSALAQEVQLELVAWGRTGKLKALLLALPYLFIGGLSKLAIGGIDVIHAQDGVVAPVGYLLAKLFRRPLVVVIHGLDITYQSPLFRLVVPRAVRRADAVVCISTAAAKAARDSGVAADNLIVVPLAVQDDMYGQSDKQVLLQKTALADGTVLLLTVGRLVRRKGVAWFIEYVLPGLVQQDNSITYLVIGEGEEEQTIRQAIAKSHMGSHVRLLGKADKSTLEAAYNGADLFVMPNISVPGDMEGFGLVLLEAALCKLPAIAADTEGIQDAVKDGKNAVLVPSGDARAFQAAIIKFLGNKTAAQTFGKRSREYTLRHYQWSALAKRYVEIYQRMS